MASSYDIESGRGVSLARPHFRLNVWVPPDLPELKEFYLLAKIKHNSAIYPVLSGARDTFDAGFDLICPGMISAVAQQTTKINHRIRCSMTKVVPVPVPAPVPVHVPDVASSYPRDEEHAVGYYLYPRSSTGTKTPLRLANSVGIIDSGYRGDIIAAFDNWRSDDYVVDKGHRVVQLCPPDLSYPLLVDIVDELKELGKTERGEGGFGSTGS